MFFSLFEGLAFLTVQRNLCFTILWRKHYKKILSVVVAGDGSCIFLQIGITDWVRVNTIGLIIFCCFWTHLIGESVFCFPFFVRTKGGIARLSSVSIADPYKWKNNYLTIFFLTILFSFIDTVKLGSKKIWMFIFFYSLNSLNCFFLAA